MLSKAVDEQAEDHDEAKSDDALRLFDEDRRGQKQRIFQEAKAAFDAALLFIRRHEFLIREDGCIQDLYGSPRTSWLPEKPIPKSCIDARRYIPMIVSYHSAR